MTARRVAGLPGSVGLESLRMLARTTFLKNMHGGNFGLGLACARRPAPEPVDEGAVQILHDKDIGAGLCVARGTHGDHFRSEIRGY